MLVLGSCRVGLGRVAKIPADGGHVTAAQWFVVAVLVVPLGLVVRNRLRPDVAALTIAALLGIAQFLGLGVLGAAGTPSLANRAISGFSQNVILTLLSLFIITQALDKTGVTRFIARRILAVGGSSERRYIILFTATTACLSLLMNNLAAGALLVPSAMDIARRTRIRPSKLLMPIAYGSLLGGSATFFTTANIIVSDLLTSARPPQAPLHVWDFTPAGGLMAIAGIVYIAIFGPRLLPDREPNPEQGLARRTGSELEQAYHLGERFWEVTVMPKSPFAGGPLGAIGIGSRLGLTVPAIWHGRQAIFAPSTDQVIQAHDILTVIGREERVKQLADSGLQIGREAAAPGKAISARGATLVEALLEPRSEAQDRTLKQIEFRKRYGFTVVALLRGERSYRTDVADIPLKAGDSLLMVGPPERLKALRASSDFIVLEADPSDQPVHRREALSAVVVTLAAVVASILGAPTFLSMLTGAVVLVGLNVISIQDSYRSIEWQAIMLVAGMYAASLAMVNTGLAELVGKIMVGVVTPFGPLGVVAGAYILSGLLSQFMGGQVTALVTGPIAISAALSLNTNPQAVAVVTAIGCSAVFLTPLAHPVNILMMGPANYRFGDFFKLGAGLTLVCFVTLMLGMTLFWRL